MGSHQQSSRVTRPSGNLIPVLAVLAATAALIVVLLLAIGQPGYAAAAAVLLLVLLGAGAFDALVAHRKLMRHHGDTDAIDADERNSVPTMTTDPDAPLGATRESHTDVDPHDLPPDHPSRPAVEEEAAQQGRRR